MSGISTRVLVAVSILLSLVIGGSIAANLFSAARAAGAASMVSANTASGITVCGHGTAKATPDRATLSIAVRSQAADQESARSAAAAAMTAAIAALTRDGVAQKDIQTQYLAISPNYYYGGSGQQQDGYIATNSVTAVVRDVSKVGQIVDDVAKAGGNDVSVSGVQFGNSDPGAAMQQAEQNALADARRQASSIASSAGVQLGAPIAIDATQCGVQRVPVYAAAGAAASSAGTTTPVQPGQDTSEAYVQVIYAIR